MFSGTGGGGGGGLCLCGCTRDASRSIIARLRRKTCFVPGKCPRVYPSTYLPVLTQIEANEKHDNMNQPRK